MTQRVVNYTYGTGNPVLPNGSIDVRDGIDNLQSMDVFMNAPEDTYNQRDGGIVRTVAGANKRFNAQILNMGFTRIGTFAAGATLTNPRQTLLWDIADGGDGQEYGWSGAFPKVVPATSTPTSTGGISVGAWISRFDPELRTQVRKALRRSYAEAGYNLVDGSFEAGGTLVNANDVLLHEASGKAFSGPAGAVAAGTDPASGGFVDVSSITLSSTIKMLSSMVGPSYSAASISNALLNASNSNARVVVDGDYVVNGVITLPSNLDLFFMPLSSITHSSGDTDLLLAVGRSNISITNPNLVQSVTTLPNTYTSCIQLTSCSNVDVVRGSFSGYARSGVIADASTDVTVSRSLFSAVGVSAYTNSADIAFYNGSSNCTAILNKCVAGSVVGIMMQLGTTNCRVIYNTVKNCTGYGITSYDNDDAQNSESIISANYIDNILGSVIYDGQTQRLSGAGIYLLNARNMHVCNNTVKNTNILTEAETLVPGAIATNGAKGAIVIEGNIIEDPRWYGIALFSESAGYEDFGHITVSGGSVNGKALALAKSGVYVKNRGNVTINGVRVHSKLPSDQGGILISNPSVFSRTISVKDNKVTNFSLGISASNQTGLIISDNSVDGAVTAIRMTNCSKSNLTGGLLRGHTVCGIDLVDVTGSNVSDVVFDSTTSVDDVKTRGTSCAGTQITIKQRTGKLNNTCLGARVIDQSDVGRVSYYQKGDTFFFKNVVVAGFIGNVCTTAGPSGTAVVKNFGAIAA